MAGAENDPPNARYRRLAQQCLDALKHAVHSETRATLTHLAQTFFTLAEEYEAAHPPVVTQQQQQMQPPQQIQPKEDEPEAG
jgi:hypothetical protein